MTYTFRQNNLDLDRMTFSVANGPLVAELSIYSQAANQLLDLTATTQPYFTESAQALILTRVTSNDRYTEYEIDTAASGLSNTSIAFDGDVEGIYNYKLTDDTDTLLEKGVIKIKNETPTEFPNKKTYTSNNETRNGYVYLRNNSL